MGEHLMALSRLGVRQRLAFAARLAQEDWATDVLLRPPTFGVLRVISRRGPISQADTAAHLGVHASDMVGFIDGLEKGGWVSRLRSKEDRRRYDLMLTIEGWKLLRRMELIAEEVEETFLLVLSDAERELIDDLLGKLLQEHVGLSPRPAPMIAESDA